LNEENSPRTASELLFEEYLRDRELSCEYEPEIEGTTKRPDYQVSMGGAAAFFEVKEFEPQNTPQVGSFDPYPRIRSKINEARKKFKNFTDRMCVLVLANPRHAALVLLEPLFVFCAMLGDLGWTMPFDPETGGLDDSRMTQTFLSGGRMVRYKNGQAIAPQNTTISAVCVLGHVAEGSRRLEILRARRERETGRPLAPQQLLRESVGTAADPSIRRLRVVVCENPYAATPLTHSFGRGPHDERFGLRDGRLCRLFVGSALETLEANEREAGITIRDGF